jgi:uncharacterized repeat protein (TIGR03803 family)
LKALHSFGNTDAANPRGGIGQASDGNLYGTTGAGGSNGGNVGSIFKITPSGALATI